mgnify:CR=1 FL=1
MRLGTTTYTEGKPKRTSQGNRKKSKRSIQTGEGVTLEDIE